MATYITSNPSALAARRYLDANNKELTKAQNQLSSGLLTYDPSELPAASAIGIQFAADLQILSQASSNATQASALMQLASGTLQGSNEILTRLNVLSAQSNSDSVGEAERQMFDLEYQALMTQLDLNAKVQWRGTELFTTGDGTASLVNATGAGNMTVANNDSANALVIAGSGNIATFLEVDGDVMGNLEAVSIGDGAGNSYITIGGVNFASTADLNSEITGSSFVTFVSADDKKQKVVLKVSSDGYGAGSSANLQTDIEASFDNFTLTQNVDGLTSVPSWFSGGLDLSRTEGMYNGTASYASVLATASGNYVINVTIGNQVFESVENQANAPVAGGTLVLTSTANSSNKIALNFDHSITPTFTSDIDDYAGRALEYQSALRTLLGINGSVDGAAVFESRSAPSIPGIDVKLAGAVQTGTYGLQYTASNGSFKLTTPSGSSIEKVVTEASINAGSVIDFGNGVQIKIVEAAEFDPSKDKGLTTIKYDGVAMSFQTGMRTVDVVDMSFLAATSAALGVTGTNVLTKNAAEFATNRLEAAVQKVNLQIAGIGSKKSQLEEVIRSLAIMNQNLTAAKATFTDADIPASLQSAQRYQALVDVSTSVFQSTIGRESQLSRMVTSSLRN
jgi:flagellin-like hook-associated protein FlgL